MLEAINIQRSVAGRCLLDHVSLVIRPGQRLALVGQSGSGKTLLLRSLALLDPIDGGEVRWQGQRIALESIPCHRGNVVYVHQRASFLEGNVEYNLQFPFSMKTHHDRSFARDKILDQLQSLGRDATFLAQQQTDLSGGESQIVALLRAMQLNPAILLLDEPTAALDAASTEIVERLIVEWLDADSGNRSIVLVTHDATQADRLGESVGTIENGKLELTA